MNSFQDFFDRQKGYFATGVTRSYAWRIEQLDRMARLVGENEIALQEAIAKDFKTASQEQIFETLACLGEVGFQKSQLKGWMAPTVGQHPPVYRDHAIRRSRIVRDGALLREVWLRHADACQVDAHLAA